MSKKADFMYYPDLDDPDLEPKLYQKQEFYETLNQPRPYFKDKQKRLELIQKICNPDVLQLQQHQVFLRNFISPQTPYNSILIFHGLGTGKTCAAVTIAEGLKETVRKYNKKIYVISAINLAYNFQETLYDTARESKSKFPGSLQCTGSTYFVEPIPGETPDELMRRTRKIRREQEKYYTYMGYQKFANFVRKVEAEYELKDFFANAVFIIDEAHNLVSKSSTSVARLAEESKKAREALRKIFQTSQNNKLVFLSATPMINEINDLIVLINLLRANDQQKSNYTASDLGNPDADGLLTADNLNVAKFKEFIRGYVSYYRGGHPSSFPLRHDMTNYQKRKLNTDIYGLPLSKGNLKNNYDNLKNLKLWVCEMSPFQWYNYYKFLLLYNKNDKKLRDRKTQKMVARYPHDSRDITKTQASNIIFPIKNTEIDGFVLSSETSLDNVFNRKTVRGLTQYTYKPGIPQFLESKQIAIYSTKFFELFNHIIENQGINFVYNYYVESGVIPICLMLEQNGYVRYHSGLRIDQAGKYSNTRNYLNIKVRKYRCVCGELDKKHPPQSQVKIRNNTPNYRNLKGHKFRQGTYLRVDGQTKEFDIHGPILKSPENLYGEIIKVMVGGRKTSEGIDLKYVRSVHIVNPWHNFNQIEQAIGRGIRFCSHSRLPIDQMSVKVYKYVTIPPRIVISNRNKFAISKILSPDRNVVPDELSLSDPTDELEDIIYDTTNFKDWPGSDEHVYARALGKDYNIKFAERLMKESAIDCNFNLPANINWPHDDQKANTRDCDYQASCAYRCDRPPSKKVLSKRQLNYDTYDMYFLEPKINEALYRITTIFSHNFALTLEGILDLLDRQSPNISSEDQLIEMDIIYLALKKLLGDPQQKIPPKPILDKFDRYGYIVFKEPFFMFQPNELVDQKIPLYYREVPNASVVKSVLDLQQTNFLKPKPKTMKKITLKRQSEDYTLGEGFMTSVSKPTRTPRTTKELKLVDNKIDLLKTETKQIRFEMTFDLFNQTQHTYLLELTVGDWVAGRRARPKEQILTYYLNNFLLACSKMKYTTAVTATNKSKIPRITQVPTCGKWVHNLAPNQFKMYTAKDGWVTIDETHPVLDQIAEARPKSLIPLTDRKIPNTFYGYFDNRNQEKKYKFKVVNVMGQKTKKKKATNETSKKTLSTGKVCRTFNQAMVTGFYEKLAGKKDKPVGVDQICKRVQELLRAKDRSQNHTIYFLGPNDYPRHQELQKTDGAVSLDQSQRNLYYLYLYHNQN